ncbi:MAG: hypothetical protein B7Z08_07225 [Sphingomonadales bacterium 32-68-7]|nr:MAG: hypothetical protein B7Z33_03565 [Sphingomonadales bacterium 12-68-11]OYX08939.1 MAG: hypothetical protein B7Z08_07225 [Sphingomonadales bacterium 32-68-7]
MKPSPLLVAALALLLASYPVARAALPTPGGAPSAPRAAPAPARVPPVDPEIPVALLVDLSSGQTLFAREAERRFVPASVTKIMTAYTAFKLIGSGHLDPGTTLVVSQEVDERWSGEGSSMFLKAGERVTVGQLLLGVTTVSGNDAAAMLGIATTGSLDKWLALMNRNAAELGMRDTHFGSPNGLPDEGRTYSSARDLATLAEAMTTRYPGLYRRYFGHRGMSYRNIAQVNHDPVTGVVAGADGIKTGYTREAGYTFVGSARRGDRRLVIVLGGVPSARVRNQAARDLLNWGFEAFDSRVVLPRDATVGEAQVQDGAAWQVTLRTKGEVLASLPQGTSLQAPRLSIRYRGPLAAPIAKGQDVAFLHVEIPGQAPHDVPLVAAEDVPEAGPLRRLINGVAGLLS